MPPRSRAPRQGPARLHGHGPAGTRRVLRPIVLRAAAAAGHQAAGVEQRGDARAGSARRERRSYGPSAVEGLDIYRTKRANAPIFVFIHGGAWLGGAAKDYGYPAEMFVNAGAHYVALDFIAIKEAGGDLGVDGAASAPRRRLGLSTMPTNSAAIRHGSMSAAIPPAGIFAACVLVTDWQKEFGLPANIIKGGLCMSGMYEMKPVRLSARRTYVKFTDAMEDSMSAIRHIDRLHAPITVTYGTFETPDFQRQSRDFAAAVKASGKPVQLIEAPTTRMWKCANRSAIPMASTAAPPWR